MFGLKLSGNTCPHCGDLNCTRITRDKWMRLLIFSKFFECEKCGCEFILIMETWKWVMHDPETQDEF